MPAETPILFANNYIICCTVTAIKTGCFPDRQKLLKDKKKIMEDISSLSFERRMLAEVKKMMGGGMVLDIQGPHVLHFSIFLVHEETGRIKSIFFVHILQSYIKPQTG